MHASQTEIRIVCYKLLGCKNKITKSLDLYVYTSILYSEEIVPDVIQELKEFSFKISIFFVCFRQIIKSSQLKYSIGSFKLQWSVFNPLVMTLVSILNWLIRNISTFHNTDLIMNWYLKIASQYWLIKVHSYEGSMNNNFPNTIVISFTLRQSVTVNVQSLGLNMLFFNGVGQDWGNGLGK